MIHEILLVLSGSDSPLLNLANGYEDLEGFFHPSERGLLNQIILLGQLVRQVSEHVERLLDNIGSSKADIRKHNISNNGNALDEYLSDSSLSFRDPHPTVIALARTMESDLLLPYQSCLVDIETLVLINDEALNFNENNISLTKITSMTVNIWERRLHWALKTLLSAVDYPRQMRNGSEMSITKYLIDNLSSELRTTGYNDLKPLIKSCTISVQRVWVKQLCGWLSYGQLPMYDNFMIREISQVGDDNTFTPNRTILELNLDNKPHLMDSSTAKTILSVGKALRDMKLFGNSRRDYSLAEPEMFFIKGRSQTSALINSHISTSAQILNELKLPFSESTLSFIVTRLQSQVNKRLLSPLLPNDNIIRLFSSVTGFALLTEVEFVSILIKEAGRDKGLGHPHNVWRRTIASYKEMLHISTTNLDIRTDMNTVSLQLSTLDPMSSDYNSLNDILLNGVPVKLKFEVPFPLSIFITPKDENDYDRLFSFLVTLRVIKYHISTSFKNNRVYSRTSSITSLENIINDKKSVWHLLSFVNFFTNICIGYVYEAVINPCIKEFMASLSKNTGDNGLEPERIIESHQKFISQICRGLFINDESVMILFRNLVLNTISVIGVATRVETQEQEMVPFDSKLLMDSYAIVKSIIVTINDVVNQRFENGERIDGFVEWWFVRVANVEDVLTDCGLMN